MEEVWKDITGYEGLYQVSNIGRIKSLNYRGLGIDKILKSWYNDGYKRVVLCKNKIHKNYRVHRLVAIAFILNPENKPQVNHINGIRDDNRFENLEWCNNSENIIHSFKVLGRKSGGLGRKGELCFLFGKKGILHHSSKKINQYDKQGNFIKTWDSMRDVKRELNINNISPACKGRYKTAGGFIWKYF